MEKLKLTLRYIIKTSTDACFATMAAELLDELKTYDDDDCKLVDIKFSYANREQIAAWLCKNYFIESADCDCENCIYGGSCHE